MNIWALPLKQLLISSFSCSYPNKNTRRSLKSLHTISRAFAFIMNPQPEQTVFSTSAQSRPSLSMKSLYYMCAIYTDGNLNFSFCKNYNWQLVFIVVREQIHRAFTAKSEPLPRQPHLICLSGLQIIQQRFTPWFLQIPRRQYNSFQYLYNFRYDVNYRTTYHLLPGTENEEPVVYSL